LTFGTLFTIIIGMGLFWRCPCGATIQESEKSCPHCRSSQSRAQGWYIRISIEGVIIRKFFKDYRLAEQVYYELKKKQELLKLSKKLKGLDENLSGLLGIDESEKGRFIKLKVFWSKYYSWLINHKKQSTIVERISKWKKLKEFFGEKTLYEITPREVAKFQQEMKAQGYSNGAINRYVAFLRHMITMAVKWGYLKEHTLKGKIDMLREPKDKWTFLTREEFERLFENLSETYRDLCYFLVMTGARLGEALSLKWENIIWDVGVVYLPDSKANRERVIVLAGSVLELLKRRREKIKDDRVFPHSEREFRRAFKRALEKAGLPRTIRIHDLRHTFASWLAMKGVPLQQIKDLLGHSQITTTLRYSHLNPEVLRKAVSVLEEEKSEAPVKGAQEQIQVKKKGKVIEFKKFLEKKEISDTKLKQKVSNFFRT